MGCNGKVVVAGGTDGKHVFDFVEVYLANQTVDTKPAATGALPLPLINPVLACVAERYVVISGGSAASSSGCNSKVRSCAWGWLGGACRHRRILG